MSYILAAMAVVVVALATAPAKRCDAASPITAAAFAPGGAEVVVASQMGIAVHAWPSLEKKREIPAALSHKSDVAFSPDGKRLAIAGGEPSESGGFQLFAWPGGEPQKPVRLLPDVAYQLTWAAHNQALFVAGADGHLILATPDGEILRRYQGHAGDVLCVSQSDDGKLLFSGSGDQSIRVWNSATGEAARSLSNHTGEVVDVALRPELQGLPMLASAGGDKTVRFWQPTIGRMVRFVRLASPPLAIDWTPDGRRLLVACADGRLRVIDPETAKILQETPAIDGWAYVVAAAPDGQNALVSGEANQVRRVEISAAMQP